MSYSLLPGTIQCALSRFASLPAHVNVTLTPADAYTLPRASFNAACAVARSAIRDDVALDAA
eukprot:3132959-Pleurochrysis_carterae.AAC.1